MRLYDMAGPVTPPRVVPIHTYRCGACGFVASSANQDRAKTYFLDHLVSAHPAPRPDAA